jgi:hypothetical protein
MRRARQGVDGKLVTRFTMRATHVGDFLGVAATGRRVAFDRIATDVMRDGKRTDGRAHPNRLGLLAHLRVPSGRFREAPLPGDGCSGFALSAAPAAPSPATGQGGVRYAAWGRAAPFA